MFILIFETFLQVRVITCFFLRKLQNSVPATGAEDREETLKFSQFVEEFGGGDCLPIPIMVMRERPDCFTGMC